MYHYATTVENRVDRNQSAMVLASVLLAYTWPRVGTWQLLSTISNLFLCILLGFTLSGAIFGELRESSVFGTIIYEIQV